MAETASKSVVLDHDITVNGVEYPKGGKIDVPKEVADDLARINNYHNKYLAGLHNDNGENKSVGNLAGGGN